MNRSQKSPQWLAFLADASVPEAVVQALQTKGLNVARAGHDEWNVPVPIKGLDERRAAVILAGDRVFLTADPRRMRGRHVPREHGGMLTISGVNGDSDSVARAVARLLNALRVAGRGYTRLRDRRFLWADDRLVELLRDGAERVWSRTR